MLHIILVNQSQSHLPWVLGLFHFGLWLGNCLNTMYSLIYTYSPKCSLFSMILILTAVVEIHSMYWSYVATSPLQRKPKMIVKRIKSCVMKSTSCWKKYPHFLYRTRDMKRFAPSLNSFQGFGTYITIKATDKAVLFVLLHIGRDWPRIQRSQALPELSGNILSYFRLFSTRYWDQCFEERPGARLSSRHTTLLSSFVFFHLKCWWQNLGSLTC